MQSLTQIEKAFKTSFFVLIFNPISTLDVGVIDMILKRLHWKVNFNYMKC